MRSTISTDFSAALVVGVHELKRRASREALGQAITWKPLWISGVLIGYQKV